MACSIGEGLRRRLPKDLWETNPKRSDHVIAAFEFNELARTQEHAGAHRGVRALFDEDECAGQTIRWKAVIENRFRSANPNFTEIIHRKFRRGGIRLQRLNVQ